MKDRELERLLRALDSSKAVEAELTSAGGDALDGARRTDADLAAVGGQGVVVERRSVIAESVGAVFQVLCQDCTARWRWG